MEDFSLMELPFNSITVKGEHLPDAANDLLGLFKIWHSKRRELGATGEPYWERELVELLAGRKRKFLSPTWDLELKDFRPLHDPS